MTKLRRILLLVILSLSTSGVFAQFVDITPIIGYAMHGDLKFTEGNLEINDKLNFGVIGSFPTYNEKGMIELMVSNSFASARWAASPDYDTLVSTNTNFNMNVTYFQVSWVWDGEVSPDLYMFGGPSLGIVNYGPSKVDIDGIFRVSLGLQAGVKYFFGKGIGFRLQGHMILPVFMGNGEHLEGITDYPGTNSYVTVSETLFPVNFLLNAGVIFRINFRR